MAAHARAEGRGRSAWTEVRPRDESQWPQLVECRLQIIGSRPSAMKAQDAPFAAIHQPAGHVEPMMRLEVGESPSWDLMMCAWWRSPSGPKTLWLSPERGSSSLV